MRRRAVLAGILASMGAAARAEDRDPPRVVETLPADGDLDVDPALGIITVRFDQPMKASWSFVTKGEAPMPTIGQPHLADDRTVVASMTLEPGRDYVVWLNSERYRNFQSRDGRPAKPRRIAFRTRLQQG